MELMDGEMDRLELEQTKRAVGGRRRKKKRDEER